MSCSGPFCILSGTKQNYIQISNKVFSTIFHCLVFLNQKMTHVGFKNLLCLYLRLLTRVCECTPCCARLSFGCVMGCLESFRLRDSWESTQGCLFPSVRFLTVSRAASPPKPCNIPLMGNSVPIPRPTQLV